jgi:hypothetical protein
MVLFTNQNFFMKNTLQLLASLCLVVLIVSSSFAQKNKKEKSISEAHIVYKMSGEGAMAAAIEGSTMDLYFAPDHVKMLANMMSGMVQMDVRVDNKSSKGIMLMDMMGQKKVIEMAADDLNKSKKNAKPAHTDIKYLNKFKKIAGYKCQEVEVSMEGIDEPATVYITEKIQPQNMGEVSMMQFTGLKGFPLMWKIEQQGMKIIMEATEVSTAKLPKGTFDMTVPDGYEKMEMDDLKNMGGFGL